MKTFDNYTEIESMSENCEFRPAERRKGQRE